MKRTADTEPHPVREQTEYSEWLPGFHKIWTEHPGRQEADRRERPYAVRR